MSGIDDLMAESNDRWAHATRRAHGIADDGLGEAVRIYYTRYFPAGVIVLTSAGTGVGILAFGGDLVHWASYLAFGFFLTVLGVFIGGLVYNAKKVVPAAIFGRVDVLLSLESGEQKHVRRQIRGKAAIDPERLEVTRAAAVQLRKGLATQLILAPMYPFIFIPQSVNFALRGDRPAAWLMAVGVVFMVVAIAFLARDFRRAGRFLIRTAQQGADADGTR